MTKIQLGICLYLLAVFNVLAEQYKLTDPPIIIEPPAGFSAATSFNGFEQIETFTTIKLEQNELTLSATLAAQLKQNLETLESENISVSGLEGLLITHQKTIGQTLFHQMSLIFGDELGSVKVIASYPQTMAKSMGPMIKKTLTGVKMRRVSQSRLFNRLPFVIQDSADLIYQTRTENSVILVDKAPYDPQTSFQPLYVVSHSQVTDNIDDVKQLAQQLIETNRAFRDITPVSQKYTTLAGVQAHRIIAKARHRETQVEVLFYQVLAINDNRFLVAQGAAPYTEKERFIIKFDQITDNISFKNSTSN